MTKFEQIVQGIPAFHDFTIRDPRYLVILFLAPFHDFEEKKSNSFFFFKFFFQVFFVLFFSKFLFTVFVLIL